MGIVSDRISCPCALHLVAGALLEGSQYVTLIFRKVNEDGPRFLEGDPVEWVRAAVVSEHVDGAKVRFLIKPHFAHSDAS